MTDTSIEWCQRPGTRARSWNPTQGCSLVSEGCRNCYAMRMAARFAKDGWSKGLINLRTGKWSGDVRMAGHKLAEPLGWRDPSTVFVNSMSDLFHDGYTNEQIAAVIGVIAACQQHTFIVVTKRAKRMRDWFAWVQQESESPLSTCGREWISAMDVPVTSRSRAGQAVIGPVAVWPLPNLWLLVSTENQEAANERIPYLLETPAVVRGVSAEPLIGQVMLIGRSHASWCMTITQDTGACDCGAGTLEEPQIGVDWVIAGCESGPGSRACDVAWLRSLRDQCKAAGVPFFLKQATEHNDGQLWEIEVGGDDVNSIYGDRRKPGGVIPTPFLDGCQHIAWPAPGDPTERSGTTRRRTRSPSG